MTENKLDSLETARAPVPKDKESSDGRQLLVEGMLLKGATYTEIEQKLRVSTKTIAKVSKNLIRRNAASEESVREILKTRMLAVASKSLSKLSTAVDSEDDAKALQSIFNSTYDRAVGKGQDNGQAQAITVSIANAFASPLATATQVTEEAEVTVDVTSEASDS